MKFTIITHAKHKIKGKSIFAYEPYVREMNLWLKYVDEVQIVTPVSTEEVTSIEIKYEMLNQACLPDRQVQHGEIELTQISSFDITSFKNGLSAIFVTPKVMWQIYKAMKWADHIHLRCPGNIGLLGCFVQMLFPNKPKTIKYAGNWDSQSKQPLSYRLQKWILSNTFLTRNAKVLAYGEWPNQTKNIVPFFTATYSEKECHTEQACAERSRSNEGFHEITTKDEILNQVQHDKINRHSQLDWESHDLENDGQIPDQVRDDKQNKQVPNQVRNEGKINFIYVGALTKGKQPLLSVQVIHQLKEKGHLIKLDMYGEGSEQVCIEKYIEENNLQNEVILHGNVVKETVKRAYKKAHFLLFISRSEGWPKVIAEAMFWGCLPISSGVSCIPYMLGDGTRGAIVNPNINEIVSVIEDYIKDKESYEKQTKKAMEWSRQYTLEKFEEEIKKLL